MKIKFLLLVIAVIFLTACAYSESPVGEYTPVPLEQIHPTDTQIPETDLPVEELPSCAHVQGITLRISNTMII